MCNNAVYLRYTIFLLCHHFLINLHLRLPLDETLIFDIFNQYLVLIMTVTFVKLIIKFLPSLTIKGD